MEAKVPVRRWCALALASALSACSRTDDDPVELTKARATPAPVMRSTAPPAMPAPSATPARAATRSITKPIPLPPELRDDGGLIPLPPPPPTTPTGGQP